MRILGIELGSWSVKAVEMESRFRKIEILDFHEVRLPLQTMDPTATYAKAVQTLLARLPSHPEKVVTSLPSSQTALRFLKMPIKQLKQVEKMYRFELEDNIPFKMDESIVEHHVEKFRDGSLVVAAIAPKKHIQSYLEWLKQIGLDPDWITFDGMGVLNLFLSHMEKKQNDDDAAEEQGPTLLLDIGHIKTNLSIIDDGKPELFRTISWGGANITQAISMATSVSLDEAEACKMNDLKMDLEEGTATPEIQEISTAATQAFSSLIADINHSLGAYRATFQKQPTSVVVTGGTAKVWGIENYFESSLRLPTTVLKHFQTLELKDELSSIDENRFGEALGRAYVFARKAKLLFNFRKQELGKETSIREVSELFKNPSVVTLLKFASIFAGILFLHVNVAQMLADKEAKNASDELKKVLNETFSNIPTKLRTGLTQNPSDLKKFIDQKNKEMEQKLKMLSKTRKPMLGLIRQVSAAFPESVKVDVNNLQLDDRSFLMEGVVYQGDLNIVTDELKKITSLNKVSLQREDKRFTFRAEMVGK